MPPFSKGTVQIRGWKFDNSNRVYQRNINISKTQQGELFIKFPRKYDLSHYLVTVKVSTKYIMWRTSFLWCHYFQIFCSYIHNRNDSLSPVFKVDLSQCIICKSGFYTVWGKKGFFFNSILKTHKKILKTIEYVKKQNKTLGILQNIYKEGRGYWPPQLIAYLFKNIIDNFGIRYCLMYLNHKCSNWFFLNFCQVKLQKGDGNNEGMEFNAIGSVQATGNMAFGGLLYVYTTTELLLWKPIHANGHLVFIGSNFGSNQNMQFSDVADVDVSIYYLSGKHISNCWEPSLLNTFL